MSEDQFVAVDNAASENSVDGSAKEFGSAEENTIVQESADERDAKSAKPDDSVPAAGQSATRSPSSAKVDAGDSGNAKQKAKKLASSAERLAADGEYSKAFLEARNAWTLVSQFPADPECKTLTDQLLDQMRTYGSKANDASGIHSEDKIIIVK